MIYLAVYRLRDGPNCLATMVLLLSRWRDAVLLLDEIDLASNKIMCLQPILEVQASMLKRLTSL